MPKDLERIIVVALAAAGAYALYREPRLEAFVFRLFRPRRLNRVIATLVFVVSLGVFVTPAGNHVPAFTGYFAGGLLIGFGGPWWPIGLFMVLIGLGWVTDDQLGFVAALCALGGTALLCWDWRRIRVRTSRVTADRRTA
jgi:hypothetical protein